MVRATGNQKAVDGEAVRKARPSPHPQTTQVQFPKGLSPWVDFTLFSASSGRAWQIN